MIEDYCKFFANIAKDPEKIISGLTVKDYLLARQHITSCDKCAETVDIVNASNPNGDDDIKIGLN